MCIFFIQFQFYTAQNVRIWYSFYKAQLKNELFSNKERCDLVSCFLSFPSHGFSCVFCFTPVACLIKLFCSSAFTFSVSLLCSVCSTHFWNHLQSQGGKEAKIHFGATWKQALISQIEPSDGTNSQDKMHCTFCWCVSHPANWHNLFLWCLTLLSSCSCLFSNQSQRATTLLTIYLIYLHSHLYHFFFL